MKVLVIEDNAEIQFIIEYLLKEEGYEVVSNSDGSDVDSLDMIKPNLIIIDELLPGIKGSDLCKQIKNQELTKHIPVIIISAVAGVHHIAQECGADGYIEKPFNIDNFIEVIKGIIK